MPYRPGSKGYFGTTAHPDAFASYTWDFPRRDPTRRTGTARSCSLEGKRSQEDPEVRRLWKKFQQVLSLPEKDRRAVIRLVNSLVGAKVAARR